MTILMLMTVVDVVLRKWFGIPFSGSYELTMIMLSLIVMYGFGYANDFKEHVVIDLFYRKYPENVKKLCSMLVVILTIIMTATLTFVVFRQGVRLYATGEVTFSLKLPKWIFAFIGGFGFIGYFLSALNDFCHVFIEGKVFTNDPN